MCQCVRSLDEWQSGASRGLRRSLRSSVFLLLGVVILVAGADKNEKCVNPVLEENAKPGSASTEWDINGAGDPSIQGFSTAISVNVGEEIHFKVRTNSTKYRVDIYRMGYYNGTGARLQATVRPSAALPQEQPGCQYEASTQLVDCGNWHVSASWPVPLRSVSGVYFARLVREDPAPASSWRVDGSRFEFDRRFSRPRDEHDPKLPPPASQHTYGLNRGLARSRTRLSVPRASHVYFVVRQDERRSDIVVQTMETTWQAYNCWGSLNTYGFPCDDPEIHAGSPQYQTPGEPPHRAYKASFNRPFATRQFRSINMPFGAEYPLIRFLERNGYDVAYIAGLDTHRDGESIAPLSGLPGRYKLFVSSGHDEYWSKEQRMNVERARDVGVHLAFFSGNEMYWKMRWEPSVVDGSPFRTVVVYKESQSMKRLDPVEWTGTFRDGRSLNPEGPKPETSLTGTTFTVNAWRHDALEVPGKYARHRFWRGTSVSNTPIGEVVVLLPGILGHEWDEDIDNGYRPAGIQRLSETTVDDVQMLLDEGGTFDTGTATHHLMLYRHPTSGSLVFGAGTVQYSWGLDPHHDNPTGIRGDWANQYTLRVGKSQLGADLRLLQATVNLFADMGIQPGSLESGLQLATKSNDTVAPSTSLDGCRFEAASNEGGHPRKPKVIRCTGTARDIGGVVAAVEVSTNGGVSWHPAMIDALLPETTFSYTEVVQEEARVNVECRAADDSGNLEVSHG